MRLQPLFPVQIILKKCWSYTALSVPRRRPWSAWWKKSMMTLTSWGSHCWKRGCFNQTVWRNCAVKTSTCRSSNGEDVEVGKPNHLFNSVCVFITKGQPRWTNDSEFHHTQPPIRTRECFCNGAVATMYKWGKLVWNETADIISAIQQLELIVEGCHPPNCILEVNLPGRPISCEIKKEDTATSHEKLPIWRDEAWSRNGKDRSH